MITIEHLVRHTEGNYRIPAGLAVEPAPDAPGHFILREFPEHIFGPAGVSGADKSCLRRMAENGEFYIDGQNVTQEPKSHGSTESRPTGNVPGSAPRGTQGAAGGTPALPGQKDAVPAYLKPYLNVQGVEVGVGRMGNMGSMENPQSAMGSRTPANPQ